MERKRMEQLEGWWWGGGVWVGVRKDVDGEGKEPAF